MAQHSTVSDMAWGHSTAQYKAVKANAGQCLQSWSHSYLNQTPNNVLFTAQHSIESSARHGNAKKSSQEWIYNPFLYAIPQYDTPSMHMIMPMNAPLGPQQCSSSPIRGRLASVDSVVLPVPAGADRNDRRNQGQVRQQWHKWTAWSGLCLRVQAATCTGGGG